jgi:hypothetical protein
MEMENGMTMVERVARELCRSWLEKGLKDLSADGTLGATDLEKAATVATIDLHWENFVDDAVTALQAMHEPTEAMLDAGQTPGWSRWEVRGRFNLMIAAAIKEHEGQKR